MRLNQCIYGERIEFNMGANIKQSLLSNFNRHTLVRKIHIRQHYVRQDILTVQGEQEVEEGTQGNYL